ncbi:MAG: SDR family oxidoreductase [Cyanobacteria bacterium P01_F01_bin.86]
MKMLINKVAIITGASSGIGRATAKLFATKGAQIIVAARRQIELDALVQEISQTGGKATALAGDVKDETFAKQLVDLAISHFGGLDIAFNNAGIMGEPTATPDLATQDWEAIIRTNLTSAFLGAKYQLPAMMGRQGASLIFTSSFVGYTIGLPGAAAYAASKAGLLGLTQALAAEYGNHGIRVNALLPGGTDTDMGRAFANSPEALSQVQKLHALKRIATPEEIARSVLYLASELSSFMTGTALLVDGGVSICRS